MNKSSFSSKLMIVGLFLSLGGQSYGMGWLTEKICNVFWSSETAKKAVYVAVPATTGLGLAWLLEGSRREKILAATVGGAVGYTAYLSRGHDELKDGQKNLKKGQKNLGEQITKTEQTLGTRINEVSSEVQKAEERATANRKEIARAAEGRFLDLEGGVEALGDEVRVGFEKLDNEVKTGFVGYDNRLSDMSSKLGDMSSSLSEMEGNMRSLNSNMTGVYCGVQLLLESQKKQPEIQGATGGITPPNKGFQESFFGSRCWVKESDDSDLRNCSF